MRRRNVSVGSNPRAIGKIPCGDRDARRDISVGSEPTEIHKIPCGDRDARRLCSIRLKPTAIDLLWIVGLSDSPAFVDIPVLPNFTDLYCCSVAGAGLRSHDPCL
jgi:hypothetical protein